MIPQNFEYSAPATLCTRRSACWPTAARKSLAGGMSLIPLMKLRLAAPGAAGRPRPHHGLELHPRSRTARCTSARPRTHHEIETFAAAARASARCWPKPRRTSATCRCATWEPSAAASRMPIRRPIIRPRCMALEAKIVLVTAQGGSATVRRRLLRRHVHHRARAGRDRARSDRARGERRHRHQLPESGAAGLRIRDGRRRRARDESGGKITMARIGVTGLSNQGVSRDGRGRRSGRHCGIAAEIRKLPRRGRRGQWTPTPICTLRRTIASIWPRVHAARATLPRRCRGRREDHRILTCSPFRRSTPTRLLQDPAVLAEAMPGCESLEKIGEDEYEMKMKMAIASISGVFDGKVRITDQNPPTVSS